MVYTLDTHATVRSLEAAGLEPPAAEAIVSAMAKAGSEFATKADLEAAIAGLRSDIHGVEKRLILAVVLVAGLLFTALRFFG